MFTPSFNFEFSQLSNFSSSLSSVLGRSKEIFDAQDENIMKSQESQSVNQFADLDLVIHIFPVCLFIQFFFFKRKCQPRL